MIKTDSKYLLLLLSISDFSETIENSDIDNVIINW